MKNESYVYQINMLDKGKAVTILYAVLETPTGLFSG